jgi:hypothetical protein
MMLLITVRDSCTDDDDDDNVVHHDDWDNDDITVGQPNVQQLLMY